MKVEVQVQKEGPGVVKASDIEAPADLEILNPNLEICNLGQGARFEMTLTIARGRGYVAAEGNKGPETTIGVIPVDSIFSPVRRVSYDVDAARVGQRTDFDKLKLEVTTNGSSFTAKIDGQVVLTGTDSSYASGQAGVRVWSGGHASFDNVKVSSVSR